MKPRYSSIVLHFGILYPVNGESLRVEPVEESILSVGFSMVEYLNEVSYQRGFQWWNT